jgi:hypothetical protein
MGNCGSKQLNIKDTKINSKDTPETLDKQPPKLDVKVSGHGTKNKEGSWSGQSADGKKELKIKPRPPLTLPIEVTPADTFQEESANEAEVEQRIKAILVLRKERELERQQVERNEVKEESDQEHSEELLKPILKPEPDKPKEATPKEYPNIGEALLEQKPPTREEQTDVLEAEPTGHNLKHNFKKLKVLEYKKTKEEGLFGSLLPMSLANEQAPDYDLYKSQQEGRRRVAIFA